jgi:hypothetical protein
LAVVGLHLAFLALFGHRGQALAVVGYVVGVVLEVMVLELLGVVVVMVAAVVVVVIGRVEEGWWCWL